MRVKSMLSVGFLSLMAATAVINGSDSFAAAPYRVDVIETPNETVAQPDSDKARGELTRVDVKENIESEGPVYPYTNSISH